MSIEATESGRLAPGAPAPGQAPQTAYGRPYRPVVQLVARGALWTALALGAVGGTVTLLGLGEGEGEHVPVSATEDSAAGISVPAPVAGTAELAVAEWLTATEEDREHLDSLFVEPVTLPADDGSQVEVQQATTVAGHLVQDGYWAVTVRTEVVEQVDGAARPPATWFVEVGIVGDVGEGLAALSTPGIMPAPRPSMDGWSSTRPTLRQPSDDDPVATTVEGFLVALLTGRADPSPYLAPGAVVPVASSPLFTEATVDQIATEERDDGDLQVWVDVTATTAAGREQPVAYELIARPRSDRWEVVYLWGAPSLGSAPES